MDKISPLFHNVLLPVVKKGTRFALRDKRLFEIGEVEISRVDCTQFSLIFFCTLGKSVRHDCGLSSVTSFLVFINRPYFSV